MGGILVPEGDLDPVQLEIAKKYSLPLNKAAYEAAMIDALRQGWILNNNDGDYTLTAPSSFSCKSHEAVWISIELNGSTIFVPDYALDEGMRRTGRSGDERTRLRQATAL